ncbi:hypothetical protein [Moritella yayanosii]|uniref:Uncharacterized protein n=1 Tax=Moritella yayanosii TaxID=69539 RepID=A0A330LUZ2_9GAMM|nr:hypothetical protein [Moritella yayanosii]SQD80660.1 protein of unknown function [Moritella yayanosii]
MWHWHYHKILVVSSEEPPLPRYGDGLAWYYDILLKHSFGNYRDLLQDVTLSPAFKAQLQSHLAKIKGQKSS